MTALAPRTRSRKVRRFTPGLGIGYGLVVVYALTLLIPLYWLLISAFKEKFGPVWSPVYLASPRGLSTARVLYEVNMLISGGVAGLIK